MSTGTLPRVAAWLNTWTPPGAAAALPHLLAQEAPPGPPIDPADLPDIGPMRDALDTALAELGTAWADLTEAQKQQLVDQIRDAAQHGQLTDLANLQVDTAAAAAALTASMVAVALLASRLLAAEAAEQDVTVAVQHLGPDAFQPVAQVVAGLLGDELRITAARAALRTGPDAAPAEVAAVAQAALDDLSTASADKQLGGTLHGAMNAGRVATLRRAPEGALYASEKNDRNTCRPCREVNGRWLGNISDLDQADRHPSERTGVLALYPDGAYGGYINCLGGINCRGTVVGVWRPKQTAPGDTWAKYNPSEPRDPHTGKWGAGLGEIIAEAAIKAANGTLTMQVRHADDDGHVTFSDGQQTITLDATEQHALSRALRSDRPEVYGQRHRSTDDAVHSELLWKVTNGGKDEDGVAQDHTLTLAAPDDGVDDLDQRNGLALTDKQATAVEDTTVRLSVARRVNTGNGPMDTWVTEADGIGLRMKDEHGKPTEVVFPGKDWVKISAAVNVVSEGFDEDAIPADAPDDYEPPEVNRVTVKTKAGSVEIEWGGPRHDNSYDPKSSITIVPLYTAPWSVAIDGDHMSEVLGRFGWLQDMAGLS
jgi:hypothetical protein